MVETFQNILDVLPLPTEVMRRKAYRDGAFTAITYENEHGDHACFDLDDFWKIHDVCILPGDRWSEHPVEPIFFHEGEADGKTLERLRKFVLEHFEGSRA